MTGGHTIDDWKKHRLILADWFEGEIVRGGLRVEFNAAGDVTISMNGKTRLRIAANENAEAQPQTQPTIGDPMPEGTEHAGMKYAGISPDTGRPFYIDAADAPGTYSFDAAEKYAASQGKRVPSKEELNVLFNNKAAIGGFNVTRSGSGPAVWYWSSSRSDGNAWAQRFSDGGKGNYGYRNFGLSLRLVRD